MRVKVASLVNLKAANGTVYVYENVSFWDKQDKKPKSKRKCIGHRDPVTGEVVPNGTPGGVRRGQPAPSKPEKRCEIYACGTTLLFNQVAKTTGLLPVLQSVFPRDWAALLTCAYHAAAEGAALSRAEQWTAGELTPCAGVLTSQRIAELLPRLSADLQQEFFAQWWQRQASEQYWCMDITSISSYSKLTELVESGYNRDGESLPQINLLLVTGQESHTPLFFRALPGSLHDVSSLRDSITQMAGLKIRGIHLVMDKGFFSARNVDELYAAECKFTVGVPFTCALARDAVERWRAVMDRPQHLMNVLGREIHGGVTEQDWHGRRSYVHVYFDCLKAARERQDFEHQLLTLRQELCDAKLRESHQQLYERFFTVTETSAGERVVNFNEEAIAARLRNTAGWFVMLSNDLSDAKQALEVYRRKDAVEKCFDDLKNDLDVNCLRIHSPASLDGRIFIQFIACVLLTYIREKLRSAKWLLNGHSARSVIDSMKSLRVVKLEGRRRPIFSTPTKTQREIMNLFSLDLQPMYNSNAGI